MNQPYTVIESTRRPLKSLRRPKKAPLRPGRGKSVKVALKRPKLRKWTKSALKKIDEKFSLEIRTRDGHCMFPGCEATTTLQNSHYIGRAVKSCRFLADNCITLCWYHHYGSKLLGYEFQKQREEDPECGYDGQYTLFMKKWLGKERWDALIARSKTSMKIRAAVDEYEQKLLSV